MQTPLSWVAMAAQGSDTSSWQGQQPESEGFLCICFFANHITVLEVPLPWGKCFIHFHCPDCPQGLCLAVFVTGFGDIQVVGWQFCDKLRGALPSAVLRGLSLGIQHCRLDLNCTFPTDGKDEQCYRSFSRGHCTGRILLYLGHYLFCLL